MNLKKVLLLAITLAACCLPASLSAQNQSSIRGFVCSYFQESDGRPGIDITGKEFIGLNQQSFSSLDKSVTVGIYLPHFDIAGKQTCIYIETPNHQGIHWHKTVENNSIVHKTFHVRNLISTYGPGTYIARFSFDSSKLGSHTFTVTDESVAQKVQAFKPPTQLAEGTDDDFDQQFDLMMKSVFPDYRDFETSKKQLDEQTSRYYLSRFLNNPKIVQKHPYYPAFEKELDEICAFPNKEGFLDRSARFLAEQIHSNTRERELELSYYQVTGQKINLKNPSDSAKAFLFFTWMTIHKLNREIRFDRIPGKPISIERQPGYSKEAFSISKNETRRVFDTVLNHLQKTEMFPVTQYTSEKYVNTYPRELAHLRAGYSAFLPNKGTGAIPIIASGWKDKNYDGKFSLSEIDGLYKPVFKAGEPQYLGGYFNPGMKIKIKIFNPKGEEIESFTGSKLFTVRPGTNRYGVYTVSFSLNDTVWQVRQFRLVPNNEFAEHFLREQGLPAPRKARPSFIPAPGLVPARPNPAPRVNKNAPAPKGAPAPRYPAPAPAPKRAPAPDPIKP